MTTLLTVTNNVHSASFDFHSNHVFLVWSTHYSAGESELIWPVARSRSRPIEEKCSLTESLLSSFLCEQFPKSKSSLKKETYSSLSEMSMANWKKEERSGFNFTF